MHPTLRTSYWAIVVLLGGTLAADAATPQLALSVGKTEGRSGQIVRVPIDAEAKLAAGALQLDLLFDPEVLTLKSIENGPMLTSALVESNVSAPGVLRIALAGNDEIKGKGTLLTVEFQVNSGDAKTVALTLAKARSWDQANNLEMTVETHAGEFRRDGAGFAAPWWIYAAAGAAFVLVLVLLSNRMRRRAG